MAYTDQSATFAANGLLTWQHMDAMAENDAFFNAYKTAPHAFSAYRASSVNITGATPTKIVFDSEDWDTGGSFDTSNGRFTPLVAGRYLFTALLVYFNYTTAGFRTMLYKNGNEVFRGDDTDWQDPGGAEAISWTNDIYGGSAGLMCMAEANGTTDYFEIYAFSSATAADVNAAGFGFSGQSTFQGALLQKTA
jgi:hypothetical protein